MHNNRWQFWIDVGGTFTDCLAVDPDGSEHQTKLLSSGTVKGQARIHDSHSVCDRRLSGSGNSFWNGAKIRFFDQGGHPGKESTISHFDDSHGIVIIDDTLDRGSFSNEFDYEISSDLPAPVLAIHQLMRIPIQEPLPACNVNLGTTRGTNALLTRTGAATALVTSSGLKDFLTIGDQSRPYLFELTIKKREVLFHESIEINERVLADGTIEQAPVPNEIEKQLRQLKSKGIESLAVCLMHSYRFPNHEKIIREIAHQIGFRNIRLSSEVAPLIKLIPRGETTVLDAYLDPVLADYLGRIKQLVGQGSSLKLMTSAGSLTGREFFSGKDSVLSGPAGGVVGAARIAQQTGFDHSIGFDMGGTSTDVSRFDGTFDLEYETEKAGVRIMSPMMAIETVAAGGGSVCAFDGTRLTVGPESAGANPGPACYGAGGPLTITDVNLFLGRMDVRHFPFPLKRDAVEIRLKEIANRLEKTGVTKSTVELAEGFLQIANHNMASAIRSVSVAKGYDPMNYVLVSFGGAGGQHCCAVANKLNISEILIHPKCSILSAYGIRLADQSMSQVRSVLRKLSKETLEFADKLSIEMLADINKKFETSGLESRPLTSQRSLDLRYFGTESTINIIQAEGSDVKQGFCRQHRRLYGYTQDKEIEVVAARVTQTNKSPNLVPVNRSTNRHVVSQNHSLAMISIGKKINVGSFDWKTLPVGATVTGPALIADEFTSVIVDANWTANVLEDRRLWLQRSEQTMVNITQDSDHARSDPIELEILNSSFRLIAEQMGFVLKNTAVSINVKERLDFSCALFSESGDLVVNAPHIPVHLGAMSETVKSIIRLNSEIKPGDVFVTNDPYAGGSHLPDVTVLTPVFFNSSSPVAWVANRAHHAEIGGIAPGSMPAGATRLIEEGVVIQNYKLIAQGKTRFDGLRAILTDSRFPSRNPDENMADIVAQIAANQSGLSSIMDLIEIQSFEKVSAYMEHIRTAAETKTRLALQRIEDFERTFCDEMDDGTKLQVSLRKHDDELEINFTGTDSTHPGNLNANSAIVSAAITYVVRCIIDEDIPLNGGILAPISIILPECFLNPPAPVDITERAAVVGGNVETSQRIVDVLLGGLKLAAASHGTMNNWLVGDSSFGYYETVGGGSGATPDGPGVDAVHCHMSNTRLTDPEIMETRYPLVLRGFSIRTDSGGGGINHGGNGMVRIVEFTRPLTLSILSSRRTTAAFGIRGGCDGRPGRNILTRNNGKIENLPSQCERHVETGDRLELRTPGGGGCGAIS